MRCATLILFVSGRCSCFRYGGLCVAVAVVVLIVDVVAMLLALLRWCGIGVGLGVGVVVGIGIRIGICVGVVTGIGVAIGSISQHLASGIWQHLSWQHLLGSSVTSGIVWQQLRAPGQYTARLHT